MDGQRSLTWVHNLDLEECKKLEKVIKKRIASLKPKRPLDLDKVKNRVELSDCNGPQWKRDLILSLNARITEDFEAFFDELVGIEKATDSGWTAIKCANEFNNAYPEYIEKAVGKERRKIKKSLPKSKYKVRFNEDDDRYHAYIDE